MCDNYDLLKAHHIIDNHKTYGVNTINCVVN